MCTFSNVRPSVRSLETVIARALGVVGATGIEPVTPTMSR